MFVLILNLLLSRALCQEPSTGNVPALEDPDPIESELSAPAENTVPAASATPTTPPTTEAAPTTPPPETAATKPEEPPPAQEKAEASVKKVRPNKSGLFHVQWYKPTIGLSDSEKVSRIILSGNTSIGTEVRLNEEVPFITKKGDVKTIQSKLIFKDQMAKADERGFFDLYLDLPFGTAQLPIQVKTPGGEIKQYQINLEVSKKDVKLTNQKDVVNSPYARRTWGVWGGLGFNFLQYEQQSSDISSSLKFQSFAGPSYYGKVVRSLNEEWAFQATANVSPGKTASSDAVKVSQGSYNWIFLAGEFTFFHPKWKMNYNNHFSEFGAQWGLQYHRVPFLSRSSPTDASVTEVTNNDLLMVTFGGTWLVHYSRYWLFETFLRYQIPYASGKEFDIAPNYAFDGSLGVIYKWKESTRIGGFWYGQLHDYKFRNHKDVFNSANGIDPAKIDGHQTLFFSNLELRIGYEFD